MKKLILALLVFCGTIAVNTERANANGAVVVFLQMNDEQYFIQTAIRDKFFNSTPLYNILESSTNSLMVARIDPILYRWVSYYGAYDYDVVLKLEPYGNVTFHYYPPLKAFIGFDDNQYTIVLLPQLLHKKPINVQDDDADLVK